MDAQDLIKLNQRGLPDRQVRDTHQRGLHLRGMTRLGKASASARRIDHGDAEQQSEDRPYAAGPIHHWTGDRVHLNLV